MGRQINYYMDCDSFLKLATEAQKLGCQIINWQDPLHPVENLEDIPKINASFYFYVSDVGPLKINEYGEGTSKFYRVDAMRSPVIEVSYSGMSKRSKYISRARIYVQTGHWNECEEWVPYNERVKQNYDKLARVVKKLCPFTEIDDTFIPIKEEPFHLLIGRKHKEYISPYFLNLKLSKQYQLLGG